MNYLKSELLKWKNSYACYLILVLSVLQLATILPYVLLVHNPIILENLIFIYMLGYCIVMSVLSLLLHEQEMDANHFQNIRSEKHKLSIWTMKLAAADLVVMVPTFLLWLAVGVELDNVSHFAYVGLITWLLLVMLNHFHMFLSLFMGKGGNLLIAFVECLFIVFATNKAFLNVLWMPIALPINLIFEFELPSFLALLGYIILFYLGNLVMVSRMKHVK
ncbi:ABC-2 family transporter permease [Streptococcus equinus]|uniref:ABC transporter permease n=1 Tax=Streptococcus equinus TaxID=1335 RepID=UPI000890A2D7|nr:ABC transporter permease [Streptococcus equinus]SDI39273.1 ABC-2 type transport system permease protein [Streptococcus equinus]SEP58684.1 ABC-2 type transport system permease protein [Streptococcus equinus]